MGPVILTPDRPTHPVTGFSAYQEKDRIFLDLHGRVRDLILSPDDARRFCEAMDKMVALAKQEPPTLVKGRQWGAHVEPYDGNVCVRFHPPEPGCLPVVELTIGAAAALRQLVFSKIIEAQNKLRVAWRDARGTIRNRRH